MFGHVVEWDTGRRTEDGEQRAWTFTFEYASYDNVGNRLSMKVDDANAHVYTYDVIYQLVFVDYNDGNSTDYLYDSLGNRTDVNESGTITSYSRNELNQYTSVGGEDYDYDDNGNLIDVDTGEYEFAYDCENRLIAANSPDANATFEYDYLGRRVIKAVEGGATNKYCYDGDQVIAEYENDVLARKFIYGPGIDEPICMIDVTDNNEIYYYHFDGLGSVVGLTDSVANVVERYSYDVFGEPNRTSDVNNPYLFTGRRYDPETGLYYYRARYYDYYLSRFLQPDPIGYEEGLNTYTYCYNNALNYCDPSGEGVYKWLYTGDWYASDQVYEAALDEAAKTLMKLPVLGGYVSAGYVTKKRVGVGAGAAVSWTMENGMSVAFRAKAQVKGRRGPVGGQAGIKWSEEKGWGLTGQGFGRVDKGVVKIDEKKNLKFGFPWAGLILSTDKSRWYNLGEEWAEILGLRQADMPDLTLSDRMEFKKLKP